jgi:two-component system phosphate regulon response regulator PhoB
MTAPLALIVEDDEALRTLLHYNLEKEGYRVVVAGDGEDALARIALQTPDFVLLDWILPKLSGLEVCRHMRGRAETARVPVIMLSARTEDTDAVRGLEIGADDYVTKPVSMIELLARIRAILRRAGPSFSEEVMRNDDISLDQAARRVRRRDRDIHLGPTEFRLLEHFLRHPRRVHTREQLLNAVWGQDIFVEARTVDVHIGRLRKALTEEGEPDPIRTVRKAGYSLDSAG